MNTWEQVKRLVIKDWQLHQKPIAAYLGCGILGLAIYGMPSSAAFYMGCIILITVLIAGGFQAITITIIDEKKAQTLPFIMSLPISPLDYTLGKIIANVSIFIVPWLIIVGGLLAITLAGPVPDGLLTFLLLVSVQLVVNYVIVLCVTLLTESEGWSIFSMVFVNLLINPFIMLIVRSPHFNQHFSEETWVWSAPAAAILLGQLLLIAFSLWFIVYRQSRRRTFI